MILTFHMIQICGWSLYRFLRIQHLQDADESYLAYLFVFNKNTAFVSSGTKYSEYYDKMFSWKTFQALLSWSHKASRRLR